MQRLGRDRWGLEIRLNVKREAEKAASFTKILPGQLPRLCKATWKLTGEKRPLLNRELAEASRQAEG